MAEQDDQPRRFKFVALGPWAGMSEDEIEADALGLLDAEQPEEN